MKKVRNTSNRIIEFRNHLRDITGNPDLNLRLEARTGQFGYISEEQSRQIQDNLSDCEFQEKHVAGDVWAMTVDLYGVETTVWVTKRKSKEEQIAELQEQIKKLEEEY